MRPIIFILIILLIIVVATAFLYEYHKKISGSWEEMKTIQFFGDSFVKPIYCIDPNDVKIDVNKYSGTTIRGLVKKK